MTHLFTQEALANTTGSGFNISNPLKANDLVAFIADVLDLVIQIGIPILVVMIIYVGFMFVAARGNPDKITKAKTAFMWTVVGAAIVLGAFVITTAIKNTVDRLKASAPTPIVLAETLFINNTPST
jgi:heme/copper-type cytochrome/quinol oxidase subunit 2